MVRNEYTKEFKIKAIELLEQSNKTLRQSTMPPFWVT
ncbi:Uncharacterised protein [Legionella maceachernii]|nr:Uncharacterised protein [Legionella maceachernii]